MLPRYMHRHKSVRRQKEDRQKKDAILLPSFFLPHSDDRRPGRMMTNDEVDDPVFALLIAKRFNQFTPDQFAAREARWPLVSRAPY